MSECKRTCDCDRGIPKTGPVPAWNSKTMCHKCYHFATDARYNKAMGGDGNVRPKRGITATISHGTSSPSNTYPCLYRTDTGKALKYATCAEGCGNGGKIPVRPCSQFGECVVAVTTEEGLKCCRDCPIRNKRIDSVPSIERTLLKSLPGHFNASITIFNGRRLLASRLHESVFISDLDESYQPVKTQHIQLPHLACANGQEDPRLFVLRGKLHIWFAGLSSQQSLESVRISPLYAELDKNLQAVKVFAPRYDHQGPVEKNWSPFECNGELYSIYSVNPHIVLKIDGDKVTDVFRTDNPLPWVGGHHRGGTPPLCLGDRYAHFTHGNHKIPKPIDHDSDYWYSIGYVEFESKPPFRVLRQTKNPLMWATERDAIPRPHRKHVRVVFPAGAILIGDKWLVSQGTRDEAIEILQFNTTDIEKALQ